MGFSFGVDFGKRFGLSLESIKAAQGQIYDVINTVNEVKGFRNFDMNYLQFPLLLKVMSGSDNRTRFNFQMGPQLAILQGNSTEILKYAEGIYNLAEDPDGGYLNAPVGINPGDIIDHQDGTYTSTVDYEELISSSDDLTNLFGDFQKKEIQFS